MQCTSFPFLSPRDFDIACEEFAKRTNVSTPAKGDWTDISLKHEAGHTYLAIATRCGHVDSQAAELGNLSNDEPIESFDEIEEIHDDHDEVSS
ncbi:hypothetical protein L228DRAFT_245614 [Xylona heveae TC161]|uniref:Uncharacterized protein n=1 Tax=Xylona heveae (strain CBS 132557 / TC161) TaxID=1328760 RepID=A0A165IAQ5_XYLHT|nr:hypothetical protein L228DRAFT_245614 [Xylona heveae TC161]KZF24634.1 hypothetical protein L228DRAFT_245614 [Xylona heveae TC161]